MNDLEPILQNIGLDEKEAKVYLACLKLGLNPVSEISRETKLHRITTYEVLKRLIKKGVASVAEKNNVRYFSVLSSDRLYQHIKNNTDEFQRNLKSFLSIEKRTGTKPKISFYEGTAGLRHVYEDFNSYKNCEVVSVSSVKGLYGAISKKNLHSFYKNKKKNNLTVKSLSPDTSESISEQMYDKKANRKIKFFPGKQFNIPNEIVIYADKVALMSFTDKIAVIIENQEITESMRNIWQMAWGRFK